MSKNTHNIVQVTTIHPRSDTRIFLKAARTLYQVFPGDVLLMVADGLGSTGTSVCGDVPIHDLGCLPGHRISRVLIGNWRAFNVLRRLKPKVVHFHDPELLPLGFGLKILGIKVVYDMHEDFPKVAVGRSRMPRAFRILLSGIMRVAEWAASLTFDLMVAATPSISRRFPRNNTVVVQNFPIASELFSESKIKFIDRPPAFAFIGYISRERAAVQMIQALGLVKRPEVRLELAGVFSPPSLHEEIKTEKGWEHVNFHGPVNRGKMADILAKVRAGLVLYHPLPNHFDAQPNKMFEYMSAGLPVIASDFPLWRKIVDGAGCGLLVDPMSSQKISKALGWILDHPLEAEAMGRRGKEAVKHMYNWGTEGARLINAYQERLKCPERPK